MTKAVLLITLSLTTGAAALHANEPCRLVHGRAQVYLGDGQFRIWHIGTHHTYDPGEDEGSWKVIDRYMTDSIGQATNIVYGDFTICPTAPFVKGATQSAIIQKVSHPVVLTQEEWAARFSQKR